MKRTLLSVAITLSLAASANFVRGAAFTPIPLNPSSFNGDPVIEATAPNTVNDYVSVTLDAGTNKSGTGWYETGYNTNVYASPTYSGPLTGLPAAGTTFVAISNANRTFQMPPTYTTNNVIFIGHNLSSWSPIRGPGTFTLTTPTAYSALSVLTATGNGANTIGYTVNHADGSTDVGTFSSTDWVPAPSATTAWRAGGLFALGGAVNNINGNGGTMSMADIVLGNTTSPVTNIVFRWLRGNNNADSPWGNGRTFIFAVSGSTDLVTFAPITVTGYNAKGIMEATGPKTAGSAVTAVTGVLTNDNTYCSFTMDGALAKTGSTWYEAGYYASLPNSGLPVAGSTITSTSRSSIQYTMPSTYTTNCGYVLSVAVSNATVTFNTPTAAGSLAFLVGGGNGGLNIRAEIQFQGGGSETNWIVAPDWFERTVNPPAYVCFGRTAPSLRSVNNTPDQLQNNWVGVDAVGGLPAGQPFARDPRNGGASFPGLPGVRLYDAIIPVTNSATPIASINLVVTNITGGNSTTIFAVSGSAGAPPVITAQPFTLLTDSTTGSTNAISIQARQDNITLTKGWQGTNNITLVVSNAGFSSGVSYQWKRAPRGGGWRDRFVTYDMSTFANVAGPNIGGANNSIMTISNATLADSADYLVVLSNAYGMQTSFVATVMVLTTNANILVGTTAGDVITHYTSDGTSANGQETFTSAIDQTQQKWLSTGLGGFGLDGGNVAQGTIPQVGPYGYIVTPVSGASVVNTIRFYCANDTVGRDPRDYLLEGSNDGGSTWSTVAGGQLLGTLMLPVARDTGGTANPLNPFTQPLTEVDFANTTTYKSYRVTITNSMEPAATALMQVAEIGLLGSLVPNPPVWVRQPEPNVTVFVGGSPTWGVVAGGYPAPKFQWYRIPFGGSATLIPNATNSTYTFSNAQLSDSGSQFYVTAQNNAGTITSSSSTLTVVSPPAQSYPSAVLANSPLGYWRLDEADTGFPNNGVVTHDYMGGHNGYYSNVVLAVPGYNPTADSDAAAQFGSITLDSYVENINDLSFARGTNVTGARFSVEAWVLGSSQTTPAAIVTKGYNGALAAGTGTGTEQFALDVTGAGTQADPSKFRFLIREASGQGDAAQSSVIPYDPVAFQPLWHHLVGVCDQPNGAIYLYVDGLQAATGAVSSVGGILNQPLPMTIGARKSTQAADFDQGWNGTIDDVAIYNTALSPSQVLAHYYAAQRPPVFSLQPVNVHTNDNTTAVFRSVAYGPGTVTYQWYNSDSVNPTTPIGGQTSPNYSFTATPGANGNYYQVVAANAYGSVTSLVVQLTVESGAPAFLWQDLPASQTVFVGHIIQLHVDPSGTAPFTYHWQRNGVNLSDDYRIGGSTTATLTIGYATNTDSANYACVVTGVGTSTSTTDAVTVTANTAPFGSGGFFTASGAQSEWNLQGSTAPVFTSSGSGATIQMTSNLGNTGRSAWLNTKQNISAFTASFVYQVTANAGGGADGITFCIHNDPRGGTTFTAGAGGSLSYDGITPSEAFQLNIYAPNTRGFGTAQNGARSGFASLLPNIGVGDNTNPIRVDMTYNGAVWSIKFTDTVTSLTFTTNITVNIPTIVGASTAWVGFTGADGGVASTQVVSVSKPAGGIVSITVQKVGNNLLLTWPSSAGAFLQTTPNLLSGWTYDQTDVFRVVGTNSTVTVPPQGAGSFFRLQMFP